MRWSASMRAEVLAALVASTGLPAVAQDCARAMATVATVVGLPPVLVEGPDADGWCTATDLRLGGGQPYAMLAEIGSLRWRVDGVVAAEGPAVTLPRRVEAEVEGLRIGVVVGDPAMDWIMAAQRRAAPIAARVEVESVADAGMITISDLSVDFPGDNAVDATARLTGLSLRDSRALMLSLPQARLQEVAVSVTTHGLFETFVLMPVGQLLLGGSEDPGAAFDGLRTMALAQVGGVSDSILDATARDALADLLADLPNPAGTLDLEIVAPGGWGAERLAPILISGIGTVIADPFALLEGVDVSFSYERSPEEGQRP